MTSTALKTATAVDTDNDFAGASLFEMKDCICPPAEDVSGLFGLTVPITGYTVQAAERIEPVKRKKGEPEPERQIWDVTFRPVRFSQVEASCMQALPPAIVHPRTDLTILEGRDQTGRLFGYVALQVGEFGNHGEFVQNKTALAIRPFALLAPEQVGKVDDGLFAKQLRDNLISKFQKNNSLQIPFNLSEAADSWETLTESVLSSFRSDEDVVREETLRQKVFQKMAPLWARFSLVPAVARRRR